MSTSSIFYDYIENVEPVCVTAQEFLRTIFAEGELQKKGIQGDGKYNAMIQIGKDKFIYLHDELNSFPDYENVYSAKMNYIAYAGESGEDDLARELHAFAIRVIFPERMVWQELKDLFDRHIRKGQPKTRGKDERERTITKIIPARRILGVNRRYTSACRPLEGAGLTL